MFEAYCTRKWALAAVNQICVIYEAMNGWKKSKDSLKDCFENVNISKIHVGILAFTTSLSCMLVRVEHENV